MRRVVYINSGALGEFLMTVFFMESVMKSRECDPSTEFYILTSRSADALRPLIADHPRIRVIDIAWKERGALANLFLRCLRLPALVITQQTFGRTAMSVKVLGKILSLRPDSILAGFDDTSRFNRYIYTRLVHFDSKQLFYTAMLELARTTGFSVQDSVPQLSLSMIVQILERHSLQAVPYVIIAPYAAAVHRSMPPSMIQVIIQSVRASNPDMVVILTGDKKQQNSLNEAIRNYVSTHGSGQEYVRNLGELSLVELTTLIQHSRLYIGVDTGTTHLAAVMHKSSLILENNSNPCWWPTYNENAVILTNDEHCTCDGKKGGNCRVEVDGQLYYRCLAEVSANQISNAITILLQKHNRRAIPI